MTRNQLRLHFSCGFTAIDRWLREVGVKAKFAPSQRIVTGASSRTFNPLNQPRRDTTRAGLAADYLRRFGPVVRCDASGAYDPEGDHWRRGMTVLSAEEVEQRALRNGWKPDAWQALSGPLEVSSDFVAISHAPGA